MSCLYHSLEELYRGILQDEALRKNVVLLSLVNSLAIILVTLVFKWWRHPLYGQNKGPVIYPIVGSLFVFLRNKHRALEFNTAMLLRMPTHTARSVRGGVVLFVTANPANVEHMLKTNFENYPKGKFINDNLRELLGDGIFNADDELWKLQRKVSAHEFTTRSLRDFVLESAKKETCSRLLPLLSRAAISGESMDLQDVFARFAFDNICQVAFGTDPACLDPTFPDVKFAVAFDKATLLSLKRIQTFPKSIWTLKRRLGIGGPKELRDCVKLIDEFALSVIKKRRQDLALAVAMGNHEAGGGKHDLLSRFMAIVDNDQGDSEFKRMEASNGGKFPSNSPDFSDVFLRDIIISFVLAGRDTSTSALSYFFWLLSTHPQVESELFEEISGLVRSRPADLVDGKEGYSFSYEELKKMHYMHAALSESMRLYPPVPADFKVSRNDDVWPDGSVVPAGSVAGYHPYAMGRMEDLWGKDCLEFKPERWLKDGIFIPQSPYKYPVFQAGPRICLGKDMVMLQMKLICASIIGNFHICIPKDYKAQFLTTLTLRLKDGLPATVRPRARPAPGEKVSM